MLIAAQQGRQLFLAAETERFLAFLEWKFIEIFVALDSTFSFASLLSALCIGITFILLRRRNSRTNVSLRVMYRALFPSWLRRSPSWKGDVWLLAFNSLFYGALFGWAVLSSRVVSRATAGTLTEIFGAISKTTLDDFASTSIMTVALFLAYELGYWAYHYLSHQVPLLWEFHKVHHTAEVLTPITVFRVHPVDTIVFQNSLALFVGLVGGTFSYLLGVPISVFAVGDTNTILLMFIFLTVHLQHSHIWISASGFLGYLLMSPAHHQIHHSADPVHFNKNFGSCLSLWDWAFGTLHIPTRYRERLTFGIQPRLRADHTAAGLMIHPFFSIWRLLVSNLCSGAPTESA